MGIKARYKENPTVCSGLEKIINLKTNKETNKRANTPTTTNILTNKATEQN